MKNNTNTELEAKIDLLTSKIDALNVEKMRLLIYFNLVISLILLAFVIGAVLKQLN